MAFRIPVVVPANVRHDVQQALRRRQSALDLLRGISDDDPGKLYLERTVARCEREVERLTSDNGKLKLVQR